MLLWVLSRSRRGRTGPAALAGLTLLLALTASPDGWAKHEHRRHGRAARLAMATVAPAPAPVAPSSSGSGDDEAAAAALRHFTAGRDLVNAGKLAEGAQELRAARAVPALAPPETDFFLGLACDGMHQTEAAITAYRRYLREQPESASAESVRERISLLELRRRLAPVLRASGTKPVPAASPAATEPAAPPPAPAASASSAEPASSARTGATGEPAPGPMEKPVGWPGDDDGRDGADREGKAATRR